MNAEEAEEAEEVGVADGIRRADEAADGAGGIGVADEAGFVNGMRRAGETTDKIADGAAAGANIDTNNRVRQKGEESKEIIEIVSNSLAAFEGTLAKSVSVEGLGVHSGRAVSVSLHPMDEDCGVLLRRVDLKNGHRDISVRYDRVEQRRLCTKVVNEVGSGVSMVEHLMCALYIAQIDNILIELDASELPILDGSAEEWLALIDEAGIKRQNRARRYLQVQRSVESRLDDRFCRISPNEQAALSVDFTIDFPNKSVAQQRLQLSGKTHSDWRADIASARTFAFKEDIEKLRKQNFALGGSLDNALVLDGEAIVNPEGLRFKDELVRHKILDLCGDLYLAGLPILGSIKANKSGHRLNNRLLQALFNGEKREGAVNSANSPAWREVRVKASANPLAEGLSADGRRAEHEHGVGHELGVGHSHSHSP